MKCPACGSDRLATRQRTGLEAFFSLFTDKRKFMCLFCKAEFRAPDRRRISRDPKQGRTALKIPIR